MDAAADKPGKRLYLGIACAVLLAIYAISAQTAVLTKSPTCDEPLHAAAGYIIRWHGDYRLDTEDPALFLLLSTLPQRQSDLVANLSDPRFHDILDYHRHQTEFLVSMLFRTPQGDARDDSGQSVYAGGAYINRSRFVFTAIAVLLGVMLARWSYQLGGTVAALVATALFSFDPNFLAHGPLVKNDILFTLTLFWLMYSLWLFGQRGSMLRFVSVVLACATAVNVKFSGIFLIPLTAVMLVSRAMLPMSWQVFRYELSSRRSRLIGAVLLGAMTATISWGAIWVVYGCRYSMGPGEMVVFDRAPFGLMATGDEMISADPSERIPTRQEILSHPVSPRVRVAYWIDDHHLLPHAWTFGALFTYISTIRRNAFLLGGYSNVGWWYYFPLAMLFKTPVATMGLAALAVIWMVRRLISTCRSGAESGGNKMRWWTMGCVAMPAAIYGIEAMHTHLNIGMRHILPIYPFIYLGMGKVVSEWVATGSRAVVGLVVVLLSCLAIESLHAWPDYIPFFNIASGGERGGLRLLGDSNLDWGQDLPLLAQWQEKHPDERLYLNYFGTADPAYYGINYVNVVGGYPFSMQPLELMDRPGILAISASNLQGTYYSGMFRDRMALLRQRAPIEVLGGSIYLYEWTADDAAAERHQFLSTSQP
jgi:Dolichyl-phosphate-mannose-protein mannosyltransferase